MDIARIAVDFNGLLKGIGNGKCLPLSVSDITTDSDGNEVHLCEGKEIHIYEEDYDWFDRSDNLIADGIVILSPDKKYRWKWFCQIDDNGVRHESDNPEHILPELTANEKREIVYKRMRKWIEAIGTEPEIIVKSALQTEIKILEYIDRGET